MALKKHKGKRLKLLTPANVVKEQGDSPEQQTSLWQGPGASEIEDSKHVKSPQHTAPAPSTFQGLQPPMHSK